MESAVPPEPAAAQPTPAPNAEPNTPERKNLFTRDEMMSALVGAIVASIVTIILSPISQSLSYLLNQRLARPLVTIEYVEFVREETPVALPVEALNSLLTSDGFRAPMMRGEMAYAELAGFQNESGATSAELAALRTAVSAFQTQGASRLSRLGDWETALNGTLSSEELNSISAKYLGAMAHYMPLQPEQTGAQANLLARVKAEKDALADSLKLAAVLAEKSAVLGAGKPGKLKIKLSILNRGDTDGLVRHVGQMTFVREKLTVPLRRSSGNAPKNSVLSRAVPVAVVNSPEESDRSTAVGRVEKSAMAEFWFELDSRQLSASERSTLETILAASRVPACQLVLYDHENAPVSTHWSDEKKSRP